MTTYFSKEDYEKYKKNTESIAELAEKNGKISPGTKSDYIKKIDSMA